LIVFRYVASSHSTHSKALCPATLPCICHDPAWGAEHGDIVPGLVLQICMCVCVCAGSRSYRRRLRHMHTYLLAMMDVHVLLHSCRQEVKLFACHAHAHAKWFTVLMKMRDLLAWVRAREKKKSRRSIVCVYALLHNPWKPCLIIHTILYLWVASISGDLIGSHVILEIASFD
jgi:hypothetical protein